MAQSQLGSMYENGHHVERDIDKAVEWYTLSGQNGCGYSYYCIGRIYDFGFADVLVDKGKALKYYKLSMETDIYFTYYYDKLSAWNYLIFLNKVNPDTSKVEPVINTTNFVPGSFILWYLYNDAPHTELNANEQ